MTNGMQNLIDQLETITPREMLGSVVRTEGTMAAVADFPVPVGALVEIDRSSGVPIRGEVIGFRDHLTLVYPFKYLTGVRCGNRARLVRTSRYLRVGTTLLGRVINAHGKCIDGLPQPAARDRVQRIQRPPGALERRVIDTPLSTGVRTIDSLLTCGRGGRIGIFSGAGVGKSVLLGMMSRYTDADVNVIGLVGERGREVIEFMERDLGPEGLKKSVIVVATSDEPAIVRLHAAQTATAVAEYFRDRGQQVLLMIDSVTRFAMAQREIGLAAGEPPATRGYPPSTFSLLPQLLERAGNQTTGSITGFYSVLVEGDDLNEPVSDAVRGLLDGHVVLSRSLANQAHFPAIDVLESLSRLMPQVVSADRLAAAAAIRDVLAAYRENEDLIFIGAYRPGSNRRVDVAIAMRDEVHRFLRQSPDDRCDLIAAQDLLLALAGKCRAQLNTTANNGPVVTAPNSQ